MNGFIDAATGFAADAHGNGVAYVRLTLGGTPRVLRVPFRLKRYAGLSGREVGYAALTAIGAVLHRRGIERVRFTAEDVQLVRDLREHRDVPAPLTVAYVRLRCTLNQFKEYDVAQSTAPQSDLTARAQSETAMHAAA